MRETTKAVWPKFCDQYEGRCYWLYLDTKELPTTGLGHRVFTIDDMVALPWLKGDRAATTDEKKAEWKSIIGLTRLAPKGGFAYKSVTTLRLSDATVDGLLLADTPKYWDPLVKVLPNLESWPVDAQLAILDMSYNLGAYFLGSKWPNFTAACKAGDFTKVAATCLRAVKAPRDYRHQKMFSNAAKVVSLKADPNVFWDTKTPTPGVTPPVVVPPVVTPTPVPTPVPEVTVKHSKTYNSDYIWFRGGNVPPVVAEVLKAVPSSIQLSQGGLSTSVPASGQTHNGLGAYDISVKGWSKSKILTLCEELIRSGEVAFPRGGWFGSAVFSTHVHVCSNNTYSSLHSTAKAQITDFKKSPRRNGLVGHGKYVGPSTPLGSWKDSPYNPANIRKESGVMVVQTDTLLGLNIDRVQKKTRKKGYEVVYASKIKRWDRWNAVTAQGTFYAISDDNGTYLKPKVVPVPATPPVVAPVPTPEPSTAEPTIAELQQGFREGTRGD